MRKKNTIIQTKQLNLINMRQIILSGIILLLSSIVLAQPSLEKLWETDTVTLRGPESVLYDSKSGSLFASSMNAGAVVRFDLNGKVIKKDWVTGLTSNKGSALANGLFYTAETAAVAVIDVNKATIVKRIPVE